MAANSGARLLVYLDFTPLQRAPTSLSPPLAGCNKRWTLLATTCYTRKTRSSRLSDRAPGGGAIGQSDTSGGSHRDARAQRGLVPLDPPNKPPPPFMARRARENFSPTHFRRLKALAIQQAQILLAVSLPFARPFVRSFVRACRLALVARRN